MYVSMDLNVKSICLVTQTILKCIKRMNKTIFYNLIVCLNDVCIYFSFFGTQFSKDDICDQQSNSSFKYNAK